MASDQNRTYAIKVNVLEYRDRETQNMQKVLVRPRKEQTAQGRSREDQSNMLRTGALINDFKTRSFFQPYVSISFSPYSQKEVSQKVTVVAYYQLIGIIKLLLIVIECYFVQGLVVKYTDSFVMDNILISIAYAVKNKKPTANNRYLK